MEFQEQIKLECKLCNLLNEYFGSDFYATIRQYGVEKKHSGISVDSNNIASNLNTELYWSKYKPEKSDIELTNKYFNIFGEF